MPVQLPRTTILGPAGVPRSPIIPLPNLPVQAPPGEEPVEAPEFAPEEPAVPAGVPAESEPMPAVPVAP